MRELLKELNGWGPGTWFRLENELTGFGPTTDESGKPTHECHPVMLIRPYEAGVPPVYRCRTSNSPHKPKRPRPSSGVGHESHPDHHTQWCRIDLPGIVVTARQNPVESSEFRPDRWTCNEPDPAKLVDEVWNKIYAKWPRRRS
jgi:hypothetical protein